MPDQPDLSELARRYVDLWQDQLIAMAADPDLAEGLARFMAMLVPAAPRKADEPAAAPAGPAAAPAASRERELRLDELARRVAALEKRLAAVEGRARAPRKGAKKGAPKRRR